MIRPPDWTSKQLASDCCQATEIFRRKRMEEPLKDYVEAFDHYHANVEGLFKATVDLTRLDQAALDVLTDPKLLDAFRYLGGPPISDDDLKTIAEAASLNPKKLREDPDAVSRIVRVVLMGLDRRRFPWVRERREPNENERNAAVLASAALMAAQRASTKRRSESKKEQEACVEAAFLGAGLVKVPTRRVETVAQAPESGQFCAESLLGTRKADFILRLWDQRIMPVECKVSNSATNSVKRLNNDAAVKAETWKSDFGKTQVVPCAVLGGVYKLHNLEDAQRRGLVLFWAHDLEAMLDWIEKTRQA
ncbi:MAG TPA: XamI family restriction endonuclease [Thermoguttaceae bacterium]|nr:XamI family restriction endonuclease [Thermoguttaceae bacterium]